MAQIVIRCAAALSFVIHAGLTSAATVSQVGDADGLGIGVVQGQAFNWADVVGGDGDGTDDWVYGNQSVVHHYTLPLDAATASLEVFTGGQGLRGLTQVLLNGTFIGTLTDGDDVGPGYNYGWKDTFDLTPHVGLLTGHDTISFQPAEGNGDGWALDYSRLTVAAVPEPETYALLGAGLAVLAVAWRRRAG